MLVDGAEVRRLPVLLPVGQQPLDQPGVRQELRPVAALEPPLVQPEALAPSRTPGPGRLVLEPKVLVQDLVLLVQEQTEDFRVVPVRHHLLHDDRGERDPLLIFHRVLDEDVADQVPALVPPLLGQEVEVEAFRDVRADGRTVRSRPLKGGRAVVYSHMLCC